MKRIAIRDFHLNYERLLLFLYVYELIIQATLASECKDVNPSCRIVLNLDVCDNYYYKKHCCETCLKISQPKTDPPRVSHPSVASSFNPVERCGRRFETDTFFAPGTIPLLTERNVFDNKIFGGKEADKNSWPWMALLGTIEHGRHKWLCGGALINDKWVLTAAHCLLEKIRIVRLGEHDTKKRDTEFPEQDFTVENAVWYPSYQGNHNYHDIALVKLAIQGPLSPRFRPVCLPWGDEFQGSHIGEEAYVTGWGARSFLGKMSTVLREVTIQVFDQKRCIDAYSQHETDFRRKWPQGMLRETTLCAGHERGEGDSCQGDSGGPLVVGDHEKFTVLGVVSVGFGCGHKDYPGIYAPVFYKPYMEWIKKVAFA